MKRPSRLVLAFALLAAAACGKKKEEKEKPTPATADAAVPARPVDAAPAAGADPGKRFEEYVAAYNARDLDKLRGYYAAEATAELADSPPEMKGVDEILASNQSIWKAFPDIKLEPQVILARGTAVATLLLMHGTHTGPLATIPGGELPPTGASVGALGIVIVEFDDAGRAGREMQYSDAGLLLRQLARAPGTRPPMTKGLAEPVRRTGGKSPVEDAVVKIGEALVTAFNQRDWKKLPDLLATDVVLHDMSRPDDVRGVAAAVAAAKAMVAAASDMKLATRASWATGDHLVMELEVSGTNNGKWPPLVPRATGKKFTLRIGQISRITGGKVAEVWRVGNGVALLQQLGIAPPPVQPPK